MATVMITGGTGLIGRRLTMLLLEKGHEVVLVSRQAKRPAAPGIRYAVWDVQRQTMDMAALAVSDYIIHLAGAGVADRRWTTARKQEIVDSRVQSSQLLHTMLKTQPHQVKALVSASAIGWYGEDTPQSRRQGFTEQEAPATDFLGNTCRLWEESIAQVTTLGIRVAILRTGIVLSNEGGAFAEFKKPVQLGVSTVLGTGNQVVSWIHIDDLCRMYLYALTQDSLQGPFNAVAPAPVTNRQLVTQLAQRLKGPAFIRVKVPAFLLRLVLGQMSVEVLKSATVSAAAITAAGFAFTYPNLETALRQLVPGKDQK